MENVLIMKDYYTILEVNRNASIDEIKKQYKILARKYHPDKTTHLSYAPGWSRIQFALFFTIC